METYDLLMIAVLIAATLFGLWKGMAWQIASLGSLFFSYFAALKFSAQLAPTFGETAPWNKFIAMLVIYMVTSFVIWTLFRFVSGIIDGVKLQAFDHQMGAVLGLAKGALWCTAITFFAVTLLPESQKESVIYSKSGQTILAGLDKAHSIMPPELHDVIGPYLHRVGEGIDPNHQYDHNAQAQQPTTAGWPQQGDGSQNNPPQAYQPQSSYPQQTYEPQPYPAQNQPANGANPAWPQNQPQGYPPQTANQPNPNGAF